LVVKRIFVFYKDMQTENYSTFWLSLYNTRTPEIERPVLSVLDVKSI